MTRLTRPRDRIGIIALVALSIFGISLLVLAPSSPLTPRGSAPVAVDDTVHLADDSSPVEVDVVANDRDGDGNLDPLSVVITQTPLYGSATVALDGSITYSPGSAFVDSDGLEYQVCDSSGTCDDAILTILPRSVVETGTAVTFAVFGDYGDNSNGEAAVAGLVDTLDVDFIATTGDNSYDVPDYETNIGQYYSSFIGSYEGRYGTGSSVNRFFPSLGDHEYSDGGLDSYLAYFDLPGRGIDTSGTSGNERYYDFVVGPVQIFVLNTQPEESDGIGVASTQASWLKRELAASSSPWRLVVSPTPPFSSGDHHGSTVELQWPFAEWGVDAVLSGNDHVYERIVLDGMPYFVSGLGGRSLYGFGTPVDGSQERYANDFGVLVVRACDSRLAFEFHSISEGIVDRFSLGEAACLGGSSL